MCLSRERIFLSGLRVKEVCKLPDFENFLEIQKVCKKLENIEKKFPYRTIHCYTRTQILETGPWLYFIADFNQCCKSEGGIRTLGKLGGQMTPIYSINLSQTGK